MGASSPVGDRWVRRTRSRLAGRASWGLQCAGRRRDHPALMVEVGSFQINEGQSSASPRKVGNVVSWGRRLRASSFNWDRRCFWLSHQAWCGFFMKLFLGITQLSGRVSSSGMILGCPPNVVSSSVSLQSARPWGAPLITWRTGFHSFVVNYNRLLSVTKSLRGSSRCKVLSYCYLMSCGGPRIAPNPRFRPQKVFFPYRRRQIDNLASLSIKRPVTRTKRRTSLLSCDNREQPDSTDNDHPTVINVLETHHRRPTSLQGIDQRPDDQYSNDALYKRTTQFTNKIQTVPDTLREKSFN